MVSGFLPGRCRVASSRKIGHRAKLRPQSPAISTSSPVGRWLTDPVGCSDRDPRLTPASAAGSFNEMAGGLLEPRAAGTDEFLGARKSEGHKLKKGRPHGPPQSHRPGAHEREPGVKQLKALQALNTRRTMNIVASFILCLSLANPRQPRGTTTRVMI